MATPVLLQDGKTGKSVRVSNSGAIRTTPTSASMTFNATLEVDDTIVEIVPPKPDKIFCLTGIVLTGNKDISAVTDATVTIFEAEVTDDQTSVNDLFILPVARSAQSVITGILITTGMSRHVMGVTTDDNVLVTILGFYADAT